MRAGEVGGAHYPKWRRSLLIDFHSRCGIGEERSLGIDAHLAIVDQFGINISGFTPSFEALGRLLKKRRRRRIIMMMKIRISHMSDFSCGETKVRNDP